MPTTSSVEQSEIVCRRLIEESLNPRNSASFDELYDPHFINHDSAPGTTTDVEGLKQHYQMFRAAFPDYWETIDSVITRGDTMVVRSTVSGTHRGQWKGIAPTGKRVKAIRIRILRVVGGKIAECWGGADPLGLMQQLGAIPPVGQSGRSKDGAHRTGADPCYL